MLEQPNEKAHAVWRVPFRSLSFACTCLSVNHLQQLAPTKEELTGRCAVLLAKFGPLDRKQISRPPQRAGYYRLFWLPMLSLPQRKSFATVSTDGRSAEQTVIHGIFVKIFYTDENLILFDKEL